MAKVELRKLCSPLTQALVRHPQLVSAGTVPDRQQPAAQTPLGRVERVAGREPERLGEDRLDVAEAEPPQLQAARDRRLEALGRDPRRGALDQDDAAGQRAARA